MPNFNTWQIEVEWYARLTKNREKYTVKKNKIVGSRLKNIVFL